MPSEAYRAAVEVGTASRRRLMRAVVALTIIIVTVNVATVLATNLQIRDLHNATSAQNRAVAALLAARNAHAQSLTVASALGIRCVLNIPPSTVRPYLKTHILIDDCFTKFDHLIKEDAHG